MRGLAYLNKREGGNKHGAGSKVVKSLTSYPSVLDFLKSLSHEIDF